jgi:hypothetical protein
LQITDYKLQFTNYKKDWELLVPIVHNGYQALSRSPC